MFTSGIIIILAMVAFVCFVFSNIQGGAQHGSLR